MRRFTILAVALTAMAVASCAHAGNANRLRLALGRTSSTPVVQTTDILGTDNIYADLNTILAGVPEDALVTLTVTGPVTAKVWPDRNSAYEIADGQSGQWYRREVDNGLVASTSAATDGTPAYWDISWSGGSARVSYAVKQSPTLIHYTIGQFTPTGYGGLLLGQWMGCTPTHIHWTISSQTLADGVTATNAFAIWPNNDALTWASTGATPTTTYGSTTRLAGTPSLGTDAYIITLHNDEGCPDVVVKETVNLHELNVAPNPGVDAANNTQLLNVLCCALRAFGDTVVGESGSYNPSALTMNATTGSFTTYQTRGGIPALDTTDGPYGGGSWAFDGRTWSNRWVNVWSRKPLGMDIGNFTYNVSGVSTTGSVPQGYAGVRWSYVNIGNGDLVLKNTGAGANNFDMWWALDHVVSTRTQNISPKDFNKYLWVNRSYFHSTSAATLDMDNGPQMSGQDCGATGNIIERATSDSFKIGCWNTVTGSNHSHFSFNVIINKTSPNANSTHPDADQIPACVPTCFPVLDALADGTVVEIMDDVGTLDLRGEGYHGSLSNFQDEFDNQGFNTGGLPDGKLYLYRGFGSVYQSLYQQGWAPKNTALGSFARNMTLYNPTMALTPWGANPAGPFQSPTLYVGPLGTGMEIDYSLIQNSGSSLLGWNAVNGSAQNLAANAITTHAGSTRVDVNHPGHPFATGAADVRITNAIAVGGITPNGTFAVVVDDNSNYHFAFTSPAASDATGGVTVGSTKSAAIVNSSLTANITVDHVLVGQTPSALWVNPLALGTTYVDPPSFIAPWQPVAGTSPLLPANSGGSRIIGALGDLTVINQRAWTYNATLYPY